MKTDMYNPLVTKKSDSTGGLADADLTNGSSFYLGWGVVIPPHYSKTTICQSDDAYLSIEVPFPHQEVHKILYN